MSYSVYVSHSAKDSELAKDLARRIFKAGGIDLITFLPDTENLDEAGHTRSLIRKFVKDSDEVIVLLTDNSADSAWVGYEMGVADSLDKRLTTVVVNEGVEQRVPMVGKHFVKYADLPKYISSLKRRAKAAKAA